MIMVTHIGSPGADTLTGGSDADLLSGLAGDNSLQGLVGTDRLWGGRGNDFGDGGAGNDSSPATTAMTACSAAMAATRSGAATASTASTAAKATDTAVRRRRQRPDHRRRRTTTPITAISVTTTFLADGPLGRPRAVTIIRGDDRLDGGDGRDGLYGDDASRSPVHRGEVDCSMAATAMTISVGDFNDMSGLKSRCVTI